MAYFALIQNKIKQNKKWQLGFLLLLFLIISFLMLLPLWQTGYIFKGHDTKFHLERAEHWYQSLKGGSLFAYSNFYSFNQLGNPLDIFYPFITFYPFALLRFFIHSPVISYYIYLGGLNVLTLAIAFYVGKAIWQKNVPAFLFTFAYFFSAYRLFDMYTRGAMGETIALTFLPLVILGIYELIQQKKRAWIFLGVGLTFSIYSHILSTLLAILAVCLIVLFYLPFLFKKASLIQVVKAVALFLGLSAIIIFPLVEQMSNVFLSTSYRPLLANSQSSLGEFLGNSFLNKMEGIKNFHIGLITLIGLMIGALSFFKLSKLAKVLFFLSIGFIVIDTLINVDVLQHTLFAQIQFVWRLNSLISLFSAFIWGELAFTLLKNRQKIYPLALIVLCSFFVLSMVSAVQLTEGLKEMSRTITRYKNPLSDKNYDRLIGGAFLTDYLRKEVDNHYYEINAKTVRSSSEIKKSTFSYEGNKLIFNIFSAGRGKIDTFVPYYKGAQVISDKEKVPISISKRGTVSFETKSGQHHYTIQYRWTMIQVFSWIISILTWFTLILYIWKEKKGNLHVKSLTHTPNKSF